MNLNDFHWSDIIVKVVAAIIIVIITALIAKFVKKILSKELTRVKALQRTDGSGESLAASLGSVGSLVVWIFGLMAVLNLFALTQVLTPLQHMLSSLLNALPNILAAGLVLFIGYVLAKIARELVVTALRAANVDRFAGKLGKATESEVDNVTGTGPDAGAGETQSLGAQYTDHENSGGSVQISTMVGQLVFAVILLVVGIAALQLLNIHSISDPAKNMLQLILDAIPRIIAAGILLAIGVMIAKFVGNLLESLLRGMDLNSAVGKLGIDTTKADAPKLLARLAQVAIVIFFAIAATKMLNFPEVTRILNTILDIGGRVIFGAVIILAGAFIANLVASFVSGRTGEIVKIATIVLFAAVGLRYMGLANSIINLAFGAVVVGGAAAAALAFGLGGRDAAARQLESMQAKAAASENSPTNAASPASDTQQ